MTSLTGSAASTVEPDEPTTRPLLEVHDLVQRFRVRGGEVSAVAGVSFTVARGETLGLVGESGCGKSTLARSIQLAPPPTSGRVVFDGHDLTAASTAETRALRSRFQMVFQDPFASLNPRWRVRDVVAEPLVVQKRGDRAGRRRRADELLDLVGLDPSRFGDRRPRQLSGGQAQRVGIARALALEPDLLICDEAVSALDVSIQAQVLNLFEQLRGRLGLTYLFISHNLSVVRHVSDRIGVMYLGKLVEIGTAEQVYADPAHPYTAALLSAVPEAVTEPRGARERVRLGGEIPSPLDPPSGCRFRTRCPFAQEKCAVETPQLRTVRTGQEVACHFPLIPAVATGDGAQNRREADPDR